MNKFQQKGSTHLKQNYLWNKRTRDTMHEFKIHTKKGTTLLLSVCMNQDDTKIYIIRI